MKRSPVLNAEVTTPRSTSKNNNITSCATNAFGLVPGFLLGVAQACQPYVTYVLCITSATMDPFHIIIITSSHLIIISSHY